MRGRVLLADDDGYHQARALWNAMIDKRPALIVRCTGTADVVEAVNFARTNNLLVAVRGGGHNVAGNALCDGGIVIDLSQMRAVHVDPLARTARVQPGATLGDVDRETQLFGLVAPGGIVSTTGISGLTLGGGFGWLSRKHGFTSDNLISADVVTADGRVLVASDSENPDLFWGIRGGGGNFGVVTSYSFRLHPLGPTVVAGMALHHMEAAPELMRFFRDYTAQAPDEMTCMAVLRLAPPAPFIPQELHGKPVVGFVLCYAGDPEEGERLAKPVKEFGNPIADVIARKPFITHQSMFDAGQPSGWNYYWKSEYLPGLSDATIDTIIEHAQKVTSPLTGVLLFQLGGAASRIPESSSAASHRNAAYVININTAWAEKEPQEGDRHMRWARDFWTAMQPHSTGGVYVNFISSDEGEDRVMSAYGREKYSRLSDLKGKYDPTNFFRLNQNIKPPAKAPAQIP